MWRKNAQASGWQNHWARILLPSQSGVLIHPYLRHLRLLSGENFKWERIGSFGAPNIKHPIDGYEIITENGESLCTIYISPYQRVISSQAPKGFYLV